MSAIQSGRALILVLVCLATAAAGHAQEGGWGGDLTFEKAVRRTLAANASIATAVQQVRERGGQTEVARGAFDVQLRTFVARDREYSLLSEAGVDGGPVSVASDQLAYGIAASRRFHSGLLFTQDAGVTRIGTPGRSLPAHALSVARVSATIPLLRGRGNSGAAPAGERVAVHTERAAILQLRALAARTVLEAGFRYWRSVAVSRELSVHREAERRARRLTEETSTLVAMDQRPASDLTQLRANLALREAARMEAEQRYIEYRHQLGLAIGLTAEEVRSFPEPAEEFPIVAMEELDGDSLASVLLTLAMRQRGDLAAAGQSHRVAQIRHEAARSESRSRLDLTMRAGMSGADLGHGLGPLFSPLLRNVDGPSSGVEVSYSWTRRNRAGRGLLAQGKAQLEQRAVEVANLERTIRSTVELVVDVLRLTNAEVQRSAAALGLFRDVVETEKAKFRLGMATLFDVIHAEEGLTRAEVAHISTLERHVQTLLVLRHETGTLVSAGAGLQLLLPPDPILALPDLNAWPASPDTHGR